MVIHKVKHWVDQTMCGRSLNGYNWTIKFRSFSYQWKKVTCKQCLKHK